MLADHIKIFYDLAADTPPPDALLHVELLTGSSDTPCCFRTLLDGEPGRKYTGTLTDKWPMLRRDQAEGRDVYMVINAGGHRASDITDIRAIFVDSDGVSLAEVLPRLEADGLAPHWINRRDDRYWHAYITTDGLSPAAFTSAQKALASRYGTDRSVNDPPRIMRLPGTVHQKSGGQYRLEDRTGGLGRMCARGDVLGALGIGSEVNPGPIEVIPPKPAPSVAKDLPGNVGAAISWLRGRAPAIQGQGGDTWTYGTAAELNGRGISEPMALALMLAEWNDRCAPSWSPDELADKVAHGYRYGQNSAGSRTPQAVFAGLLEPRSLDPDRPYTLTALEGMDLPPVEWQIDGLILKDAANLLVGPGALGKTQAALLASACLTVGRPFLGRDTRQCKVLYVSAEDSAASLRGRLQLMCRHLGIQSKDLDGRLFIWARKGKGAANSLARIDDEGNVELRPFAEVLRKEIVATGAQFVVLDTSRSFCRFNANIDDAVDALAKDVLDPLCAETGATILLLHHPTWAALKEGRDVGGSMMWEQSFRNVLTYLAAKPGADAAAKKDRTRFERYFNRIKNNEDTPAPQLLPHFFVGGVPMDRATTDYPPLGEMVLTVATEMLHAGVTLVKGQGHGQKPEDIAQAIRARWGASPDKREIRDALNALERAGKLRYQQARGHTKAGFVLPQFPVADARRTAMADILGAHVGDPLLSHALALAIAEETGDNQQALLPWLDQIAADPQDPFNHRYFCGTTSKRAGQQWRLARPPETLSNDNTE